MSGEAAPPPASVLVVDDDLDMCSYLSTALRRHGFQVQHAASAEDAFAALGAARFDVLVTDLNMRGMSGIELCKQVGATHTDLPVVVITAFGSLDTAVAAMRAGAYDFITKPFDLQVLVLALRRAVRHHALSDEVQRLRREVMQASGFEDLTGESLPMRRLYELLAKVAGSDSSVLIRGETGTGKELVARAIHRRSARAGGPFVAVNCAAFPEALLESELFGHVRGAFSGAVADHPGLFVRADRGVLFLDEVGDMPAQLQAKLLRALQERRVRPVGGSEEREVDVRIVAATHHDLETAVEEGRFRSDLFFRLNVIGVEIPPLRARGNDVLLLAQSFLARQAARSGKKVEGLTPQVAERLTGYDWPGNVRELENCIERAVALTAHDRLVVEDLPPAIRGARSDAPPTLVPHAPDPALLPTLEAVERRYVLHVLEQVRGNKSSAAKILGLDRRTLYRKLERYQLDPGGPEDDPPA